MVDDQFADRELCKDILEGEGFQVETASGGREAIELVGTGQYDVVLSDLNMPEIDGMEVVRQIKERGYNAEIIIMTAFGTIPSAVEAIKLGAFDFFIKPIDKHKISSLINRCIEFRSLHKEVNELREVTALLELKIKEKTEEVLETHKKMFALEKMKVLGELSGGVAHQLRNPLHIILSTTEYCVEKFKINGELLDCMNTIISTVMNAEKIVRDLLRTTHFDNLTVEEIPLQNILDQTLELIANKCKNQNIEIKKSYAVEDVAVVVDYSYLQQCLLNLLINACEVMPEGGSIEIGYVRQDENVQIIIHDSGPGIPQEVAAKIFTPFYTTKSYGTGLGLFFVYEVITKQFGGEIKLENHPNGGALALIRLPVKKLGS